jgi:hypothetical protein
MGEGADGIICSLSDNFWKQTKKTVRTHYQKTKRPPTTPNNVCDKNAPATTSWTKKGGTPKSGVVIWNHEILLAQKKRTHTHKHTVWNVERDHREIKTGASTVKRLPESFITWEHRVAVVVPTPLKNWDMNQWRPVTSSDVQWQCGYCPATIINCKHGGFTPRFMP